MVKYLVHKAICKIKNHDLVNAGSCPFTGKTYDVCKRCGKMSQVKNMSKV